MGEAHDAAHDGAKGPIEEDERGHKSERDAKEGHEDVPRRHVHDEEVGDGPLADAREDHGAHDHVPHKGEDEDKAVHAVDDGLEEWRRDEGIVHPRTGHDGRRHIHPAQWDGLVSPVPLRSSHFLSAKC